MNRYRQSPGAPRGMPTGRGGGRGRGRGGGGMGNSRAIKEEESRGKSENELPEEEDNVEGNDLEAQVDSGNGGNPEGYLHNERKFSWRCRLFVGNVPPDTTEKEFLSWFESFGDVQETFLNARKAFGFLRLETREIAEAAKKALDGKHIRGRYLRVRHAAHGAAILVKYTHAQCSNEYIEEAFTSFGEIERAIVCIDDKGKPNGEAIVEFVKKPAALNAVKRIHDGVFLLGSSPRPVTAELLEHKDVEDGIQDIFTIKNNEYYKERENGARFAMPNSFEFSFGQKWKELYSHYEDQKQQLDLQFREAQEKLELEEAQAQMEHQTAMMRQDLIRRQEELRRLEEQQQREIQRRMDQRMQQEEMRRHHMMGGGERGRMMAPQDRMQDRMMHEQRMMDEQMRGPGPQRPMKPPPVPPGLMQGMRQARGGGEGGSGEGMQQGGGAPPSLMAGVPMRGQRNPDNDYRQARFAEQGGHPMRGMGGNERGEGMGNYPPEMEGGELFEAPKRMRRM